MKRVYRRNVKLGLSGHEIRGRLSRINQKSRYYRSFIKDKNDLGHELRYLQQSNSCVRDIISEITGEEIPEAPTSCLDLKGQLNRARSEEESLMKRLEEISDEMFWNNENEKKKLEPRAPRKFSSDDVEVQLGSNDEGEISLMAKLSKQEEGEEVPSLPYAVPVAAPTAPPAKKDIAVPEAATAFSPELGTLALRGRNLRLEGKKRKRTSRGPVSNIVYFMYYDPPNDSRRFSSLSMAAVEFTVELANKESKYHAIFPHKEIQKEMMKISKKSMTKRPCVAARDTYFFRRADEDISDYPAHMIGAVKGKSYIPLVGSCYLCTRSVGYTDLYVKVTEGKVVGVVNDDMESVSDVVTDDNTLQRALALASWPRLCACALLELSAFFFIFGFIFYLVGQVYLFPVKGYSYMLLVYVLGPLFPYAMLEMYVLRPYAYRKMAHSEVARLIGSPIPLDVSLYLYSLFLATQDVTDKKHLCFALHFDLDHDDAILGGKFFFNF